MKSNKKKNVELVRPMLKAIGIFTFCVFVTTAVANDQSDPGKPNQSSSPEYKRLYELASNGSAAAQYELGLLFEYGQGVGRNDASAVFWYEKSSAQLFVEATYRLAVLHDNGWGLAQNKKKAVALYKTAAEQGHQLAQHDLAIMYFHGKDAPKNLLQAYKWLKIAVLSGSPLMQKHLSRVANAMSADEIEAADFLAEQWFEQSK